MRFSIRFLLACLGALAVTLFDAPARAASPDENASTTALSKLRAWLTIAREKRPPLANARFAESALTRSDAEAAAAALWQDQLAFLRNTRAAEMHDKAIELSGLRMPFDWVSFNNPQAPLVESHSLFISLHGGGNAPKELNDSQWQNQLQLAQAYHPDEGIYVAPRAPTNTWNLWHEAHIDAFLNRLIEDFVALENVNPNRVYLLGYSAGGDGVYQLASRMADRWAAAAMMGGHPNEASPLGLRNVPFAIQVGAEDSGYGRNKVAAEWGRRLDELQRGDPKGYVHFTELHAGKGHWMDLEDRKAIPWMEKFTRSPLPERIAWHQDDVTHARFYWLARPKEELKEGQEMLVERVGQEVDLNSKDCRTVTVLLNDAMLDLDQPIVIRSGTHTLFSGHVTRTIRMLAETLAERGDRKLIFSAKVNVVLP